jgi:glycerol uptake facilitator-like aquaporin
MESKASRGCSAAGSVGPEGFTVRKYCVELIGTFFLMFTVGMTVVKPLDAGALAPVAIGSA